MANSTDPELYQFVLELAFYLLIAFGVLVIAVAAVYVAMFMKGNFSGQSIARILQQTDGPKLVTIVLIILSSSLLGMLGIIKGEAVIALLSGIAGYVLGNQHGRRETEDKTRSD
jgi:hypothetical protein|tara:strand:+ start:664 stop:1005 length:342 start_codon:yes stop_codon:yes gene_type:complete